MDAPRYKIGQTLYFPMFRMDPDGINVKTCEVQTRIVKDVYPNYLNTGRIWYATYLEGRKSSSMGAAIRESSLWTDRKDALVTLRAIVGNCIANLTNALEDIQ